MDSAHLSLARLEAFEEDLRKLYRKHKLVLVSWEMIFPYEVDDVDNIDGYVNVIENYRFDQEMRGRILT